MKHVLPRAAALVAAVAATGALAAPALASPGVVPVTHPAVATSTIMLNRPDGGGNGYWANDYFIREAQVGEQTAVSPSHCGKTSGPCWQIAGATLTDTDGTFATIPGAYTPNQGSPFTGEHIRGVAQGTMSGTGRFGTFYATALPAAARVPLYNYGLANPSSSWPALFFPPGTSVTGLSESTYAYTYVTRSAYPQRWADTSSNGDGQLPGDGNIVSP